MPPVDMTAWAVVVPVKRLAVAKSRLAAYGDRTRQDLALAFAVDVVTTALGCAAVARVLVVTDDPLAAATLEVLGASVAPDSPDDGLNAALAHGAELLRAECGDCGVATLSSDLPALRAQDLAAALASVPAGGRAFVSDADSTGTTLLAAAPGVALTPLYGGGSRRRHLESGAVELPGTPGMRRDVDTPDDLRQALRLGVGHRTAEVAGPLFT